MTNTLLISEPFIRLGVFLGVLSTMFLWEILRPRRQRSTSRWVRWPGNLSVVVLNTLLLRLLLPAAVVGAALAVDARNWGLLNLLPMPEWVEVLLAVLILDLAIYTQHIVFHAVPVLWRLHRMHHTDIDFDVTTGVRFHPVEIMLSMSVKIAVVAALGAPALAVLIFEVLLNAISLFNHSNVDLPRSIDRVLRRIIVTPDMHRVHHSVEPQETNSNFGFNLPWWDRLFRTYRAQPAAGHTGMTIGIEHFRDIQELRLDRMLLQPLRDTTDEQPTCRR